MTDHYYSPRPGAESDSRELSARLRGQPFYFHTDAGVFSKKGIDFGSRLLIETVNLPETGSILDLGCGYGPVGIACAVFAPQCRITMVDVNRRGLVLAEINARRNGVEERVHIQASDGFADLGEARFDAVLTNPPIRAGKGTVHRLFEESVQHLLPGGELWVVIRKQQGAPSAKEKLEHLFGDVDLVLKKKGYWILRGKKSNEC
ncbi:class I SAM-dependent methyltransferase [Desmospora profundinema]|uniref:16S rRNA (Guanine1207-N2)-methyltransferase n=1 Tax=Desmospora profundinema TaxID=1571184 RepID=A0ABU1IQI8_9BACL|nr:class I SAM-dependent methyltransferase [Desmospora profundinema]MDR6226971.1 16S rRNA (guanine1207-N2)-methyltransferase [Desmospora profundinema]